MKVLVTGGTGEVGRPVVERLVKDGFRVKVVDRRSESIPPGVEFAECDITDFDAMRDQVRGQDAIIHLAAYPNPNKASGTEIFRVNCNGTFNVFEAASVERIKRVICASSINALGYSFGVKSFPILYFPVDEEHPTFTTDPYSFSKQITEQIAAYYWRREGISSVCLRMPWVYPPIEDSFKGIGRQYLASFRKRFDELNSLPELERVMIVRHMLNRLEELRASRYFEQDLNQEEDFQLDQDDPNALIYFGYSDFWSVISTADTAQAFEKSILADINANHVLFIAEERNSTGIESELLARVFYPEVIARKRPLIDSCSLLSIEKAARVIGYEPQLSIVEQIELE